MDEPTGGWDYGTSETTAVFVVRTSVQGYTYTITRPASRDTSATDGSVAYLRITRESQTTTAVYTTNFPSSAMPQSEPGWIRRAKEHREEHAQLCREARRLKQRRPRRGVFWHQLPKLRHVR